MREAILDASVVLKWFASKERRSQQARRVRADYESGELIVVCPGLLFLEILNVAARRWGWKDDALLQLAGALRDLAFEVVEPPLDSVASWTARGLTAYDAVYVALAEERESTLITDDDVILAVAGNLATPLSDL